MVFESIVVDVLNRVLGDYFENLDSSQLKLGIWGGDAVLNDLVLKNSAMDDLGLPFKIVVGRLGKLTMRIPWQNLYVNPVELNLQNLYLLATPSYSVVYNEQAEEKAAQLAKQALIERIEEARKKEQKRKLDGENVPNPEADGFTEKLISQIIKNVQIEITSIHLRYEDDVTKPHSPFGFGATLKSLTIKTTDSNWKPTIISETVHTFHKMSNLEGLSLYWNSNTSIIIKQLKSKSEMLAKMKELVDNEQGRFTYVLGPIKCVAKVQLTPGPDRGDKPFSLPKAMIDVFMEELVLAMTNLQFQDIMELVESIDFMSRAQFYRKYRPLNTAHQGNYKAWWKFAYRCIVEEEIRRRQLNWDWDHMKRHRNLCRTYADAYQTKLLLGPKVKASTIAIINHCEKELDVFNITLVRKQAELKLEKQVVKDAEDYAKKGWLSWNAWFGSQDSVKSNSSSDIAQKFEDALSPSEKAKLYKAIDYSENASPLDYPLDYQEYILNFHLNQLLFVVKDVISQERLGQKILDLQVNNVDTNFSTRPKRNGMKVIVSMQGIEAVGVKSEKDQSVSQIITTKTTKKHIHLFKVIYERNPINATSDKLTRVKSRAQPLEVVYHAETITQLVNCFTLPPEIRIDKLQAAAASTLNDWKQSSATGMQYLLDTRPEMEVDIEFVAPYILVPQNGRLDKKGSVLVLDLGLITAISKKRDQSPMPDRKLFNSEELYWSEIMKKSYDSFLITLQDFMVSLALPGEDYRASLGKKKDVNKTYAKDMENEIKKDTNQTTEEKTNIHLLKSSNFNVKLDQCFMNDYHQFPKLKLECNLPLLDLDITEHRLLELVKLLVTLPFPEGERNDSTSAVANNPAVAESYAISHITYSDVKDNEKKARDTVELTDMILSFSIDSIKILVTRVIDKKHIPIALFELRDLDTILTMKTFRTALEIAIGGLTMSATNNKYPGLVGPMYLLKTPMSEGQGIFLLKMHMYTILPSCPKKFASKIKQHIKAEISSLDVILHQDALTSFIAFYDGISLAVAQVVEDGRPNELEVASVYSIKKSDKNKKRQVSKMVATSRAVAKKHNDPDDILLQINAKMDSLTVQLSSEKSNLLKMVLSKLEFTMEQQVEKSVMSMELTGLTMFNLDPESIYKKIITVDAEKVVNVLITTYVDATKGMNYLDMEKYDMKIRVQTGSPKIIFFSSFVDELMNFINTFQTAKLAVVEASAAAADVAMENVQQAYSASASSRILLDFELEAPIIVTPRGIKSTDALLADLGKLSMKNIFKKQKFENSSEIVLIDEIRLHLTHMKISRIIFEKETEKILGEVLLLDPISMRLLISRNLSCQWYHGLPEITVEGNIDQTFIRATHEDYDIMMACVMDNISLYGRNQIPQNPPNNSTNAVLDPIIESGIQQQSSHSMQSKMPVAQDHLTTESLGSLPFRRRGSKSNSKIIKPDAASMTVLLPEKNEVEENYTSMVVRIIIEKMGLVMYQGENNLEGKEGLVERNEEDAFANFAIEHIQINFQMLDNGVMNCPITIQNISLEDVRPGVRAITNLIQRKLNEDKLESEIVKFCYKNDPKQGTTITIETTSITIVLCLDYLMQIGNFFILTAAAEERVNDFTPKVEKFPTAEDPLPIREITPNKVIPKSEEEKEENAKLKYSMYFTLAETEIILVETMDSVHSNALLLNCELNLRSVEVDGRKNTMGTLKNVKLSTCNYNAQNRHQSLAEVISPMSVTLVMNYSCDIGNLIDINISDIFIRLTAGTLELFLKIISSITANSESTAGLVKEEMNYSELWNVKKNDQLGYWFLKPDAMVEVGQEAVKLNQDNPKIIQNTDRLAEVNVLAERLVLESGCIVVTFETGSGINTLPMLLLETDMDLQAFDWSKKIKVSGRMKLEAAYFNPTFGLWEFIIEPVENRRNGRVSHQPWEMLFEYSTENIIPDSAAASDSQEVQGPTLLTQSVVLQSSDILEIAVTKTALEIINVLTEDFSSVAKSLVSSRNVSTAAYTIVNDCGSDVVLHIKDSPFILVRDGLQYEEITLKHGTSINLALVDSFDMTKHHSSILREQEGHEERILDISIPDYNFASGIPVNRSEKRYYPLNKRTAWGHQYAILVEAGVKDCSKVVTIRGLVQIHNELMVRVDVYYMDRSGSSLQLIGSIEAGQKFNVPLVNLYTTTCELFFAPEEFTVSTVPFVWATLMHTMQGSVQIHCRPQNILHEKFNIKVIGEVKQALFEATNKKTLASQCCYIYLKPPMVLNNLLPIPVGYYLKQSDFIRVAEPGSSLHVTNLKVREAGAVVHDELNFKIPNYNGQSWTSLVKITPHTPELSSWAFESETKVVLYLGIHKEVRDEVVTLHLYCPFWMINRTNLNLVYKGEDKETHQISHPADVAVPVLFSFPGKLFFSKKKAQIKIEDSDWSPKFSLNVAGSSGSLTAKSPNQDFQVGIEVQLSSWGVTRNIIFTPRFCVVNQCSFVTTMKEKEKPDNVLRVNPNTCVPFWPKSKLPHVIVCVDETSEETKPFTYDRVHQTLLQISNKRGAIHVDIHVTEDRTVITLSEFIPGQAPALIVNATPDVPIEIVEKGVDGTKVILPGDSQMFTWAEPTGERTIVWSPASTGKKLQLSDRLHEDGFGIFTWGASKNEEKSYYWISFLDGLQRILLFTVDLELATYLQAARDNEQPTSEYTIIFHGLGLSLIDNNKLTEVMYLRIASSGIAWETCKAGKRKRFKPLPDAVSGAIEIAYQNYLNEKVISNRAKSHITLDSGIELDFVDMKMFKPNERQLNRNFQTGIWVHYRSSLHSIQFHAKLFRLQIDNQLPDCIFRTVFAPVPPPKSVSARAATKPFAEVSLMQRITAHSLVTQFKYFKILIQEFHVRLDINFINALMEVSYGSSSTTSEKMSEHFKKEYTEACTNIDDFFARQIVTQGQKHFYDFLHFSPLKIHISFSMGGSTELSNNFLNLILASVGVTLTEIQDVVFKLSCLELQHNFLSQDQLWNEVYSHYQSQAIKQLYVLVLGLDVIGNPFGLAVGVAEGVEAFFYEPFQGAIQGPGEFAEGLALGMRSLLGSTVGGAAGAVSRITGTIGKGIAALTMDKEYQKKRRENMSHHSNDVAEGLARSSKGLVMGFVDGFTGVFTKPFQGARDDGVGGFFKGVGKGAIGLIARPTAGIVDFASGSFEAVKKATSTTDDVRRMRPPRYIPADSVLQPYICHEAEGVQLLNDLEKGRFILTDNYIAHALINPHGVYVVLLTNKRIFYLKRDELFGGWLVEWSHIWEDFAAIPDIIEKGLSFKLKSPQKKRFLRTAASSEVKIPLFSADVCAWLLSKIETAMKTETGIDTTEEATEGT